MNIEIIEADYSSHYHAQSIIFLLNAYASDPMGGGQPLSEYTQQNLVRMLSTHPMALSVLAFVDNEPAGLINCFEGFSTFICKRLLNIHDVVVLPTYRGNNIAYKMLERIESIAKTKGCCKLTLEVLRSNNVAQNLYSKFGFESYQLNNENDCAYFLQKPLKQ